MSAYCKWHEKMLREVTEHEQDKCTDAGMFCNKCEFLTIKEADNEDRIAGEQSFN